MEASGDGGGGRSNDRHGDERAPPQGRHAPSRSERLLRPSASDRRRVAPLAAHDMAADFPGAPATGAPVSSPPAHVLLHVPRLGHRHARPATGLDPHAVSTSTPSPRKSNCPSLPQFPLNNSCIVLDPDTGP